MVTDNILRAVSGNEVHSGKRTGGTVLTVCSQTLVLLVSFCPIDILLCQDVSLVLC
jgi:hypothetical protein